MAIPYGYQIETLLKFIFIIMALFNMNKTLTVALAASALGMIRMLKTPQFNKQYLKKALMNAHGQNILYIAMGCIGPINFLFYSPLVLYFAYALIQFYNQKFPAERAHSQIKPLVDTIRQNRYYIMEGKSRLQIFYCLYLLFTIPVSFSRIINCFMMAQFNLLKYQACVQTRYAAGNINNFIVGKIQNIGILYTPYKKFLGFLERVIAAPRQQQQ